MPTLSRIAIVEHHNLVRRGLHDLVSDSPLLRVADVVAEPWQLDTTDSPPDVVILGPSPQAEKDLAGAIAEVAAHGRILVVSDFTGPLLVTDALRAGAHGCVCRRADDEELLLAITTVARGGLHVSAGLAPKLHAELERPTPTPLPALALRETETLGWLASGLTHGQIARRMDLTEATVSTYVKRIRNKLNVGNKADLTRKAIELGLLLDDAE
ncbi:response regulator transcription factor [Streptomyces sp. SID11233]|nr:response regulator transcription factor [Streptomyces sp. SID11233]